MGHGAGGADSAGGEPAITRGKRLVVLIGERHALAIAVRGDARHRWSKLREWLAVDPQC